MSAPVRPTSALGFRASRGNPSSTNTNPASYQPEGSLLDENGLPLIGHLLAFTPDVIQVFQDAAKLIEESREIKRQATNQIKDAFNDAKAYSLTVNQSVAQKLADIITLAVRQRKRRYLFDFLFFSATFNCFIGRKYSCSKSSVSLVRFNHECSTIECWSSQFIVLQNS